MSRHTLKLNRHNRALAHEGVIKAPDGWVLELRAPRRTDEQNDALHGLIEQILEQRPVHRGMAMTKDTYKVMFLHALGGEVRMLPTIEGDGFFPWGQHTSRLTVAEFTDLIEWILAWCAREGIEVKHFDGEREAGAPNKAPADAA